MRRPLPAFAIASLLAVAAGVVVCGLSGVPAGVWGRNVAAWVLGGLMAAGLARWAGGKTLLAFAVLTPIGLAAPMLAHGQQGVHRWLDLGPLHMNAAMLLLPAGVVALTVLVQRAAWPWIAALLGLGLLVLQPDASQATAFAAALCIVAIGMPGRSGPVRLGIALLAALLAALAWTRADPLAPVPEVEGVLGLAAQLSPLLAVVDVLGLAAFAATPGWVAHRLPAKEVRTAGYALSGLFLIWSVAPALGAFPVPLVGMGPSPILGAWLGVGVLAAAARFAASRA